MGSSWAETMDRCLAGDLALMMESSWARWRRWSESVWVEAGGDRERRAWAVWVECHTEEFCVKVLKFEIVNSLKLFIYFSGVVPKNH